MTDTTTEAVERCALRMEETALRHKKRAECCGQVCSAGVCAAPACHFGDVMRGLQDGAATLRALAQERDAARRLNAEYEDHITAVEAERDAARAELAEAQERDAAVRAREEERAALNRAISLRDDRIQSLCEVRDSAESERDALAQERDELEAVFNKAWEADMRAIKVWQGANPGNDLVWPDRTSLVAWLLAERDAARAEVERYRIALADLVSWQDAWPKIAQRLAQEGQHMQDAVTAARAVLAGKDPDAAKESGQ